MTVLTNANILIVDDTAANVQILMDLLGQDYYVSVALDGESALEYLSENIPDLILLDIMMPAMDGYEVCTKIKSNPKIQNIPVIFLTALSDEQNERKGLNLGAVDYITKPFSPTLVKVRVRNQLELKRYRDELEDLVLKRTQQLEETLISLKNASLDTIHRLTIAAEYKDTDTAAHILRMSHYSAAIAQKLGMNEKDVESLLYAAPMHDIGKIGIPDRILLKPGKLAADEWNIMKQHTIIGGKILEGSNAEFVSLGRVIALAHHEKWDGSGYPNGLVGEQIPLGCRIVALADVFDALTSKRPYKEAFSLEKSFEIIGNGRGSHFDPDVVDAFFAVEDKLLNIKDKYKEEGSSLLYQLSGMVLEKVG
jgi:putative two-component system response regulator